MRASQLDVLSLTPLSKETDSEIRDDGSWNGNGERSKLERKQGKIAVSYLLATAPDTALPHSTVMRAVRCVTTPKCIHAHTSIQGTQRH